MTILSVSILCYFLVLIKVPRTGTRRRHQSSLRYDDLTIADVRHTAQFGTKRDSQ